MRPQRTLISVRSQNILCWKLDRGCHFGSNGPLYIFNFIFWTSSFSFVIFLLLLLLLWRIKLFFIFLLYFFNFHFFKIIFLISLLFYFLFSAFILFHFLFFDWKTIGHRISLRLKKNKNYKIYTHKNKLKYSATILTGSIHTEVQRKTWI